jgi:phage-related protein
LGGIEFFAGCLKLGDVEFGWLPPIGRRRKLRLAAASWEKKKTLTGCRQLGGEKEFGWLPPIGRRRIWLATASWEVYNLAYKIKAAALFTAPGPVIAVPVRKQQS